MSLISTLVKGSKSTTPPAPGAVATTSTGTLVAPLPPTVAAVPTPPAAPAEPFGGKRSAGFSDPAIKEKARLARVAAAAERKRVAAEAKAAAKAAAAAERAKAKDAANAERKAKWEADKAAKRLARFGSSVGACYGFLTKLPTEPLHTYGALSPVDGNKLLASLTMQVSGVRVVSWAEGTWTLVLKHRESGEALVLVYNGGALGFWGTQPEASVAPSLARDLQLVVSLVA